jgi:hypothetical protein
MDKKDGFVTNAPAKRVVYSGCGTHRDFNIYKSLIGTSQVYAPQSKPCIHFTRGTPNERDCIYNSLIGKYQVCMPQSNYIHNIISQYDCETETYSYILSMTKPLPNNSTVSIKIIDVEQNTFIWNNVNVLEGKAHLSGNPDTVIPCSGTAPLIINPLNASIYPGSYKISIPGYSKSFSLFNFSYLPSYIQSITLNSIACEL